MPIYIRAGVGYRFAVMFKYPIDISKRRHAVIFIFLTQTLERRHLKFFISSLGRIGNADAV